VRSTEHSDARTRIKKIQGVTDKPTRFFRSEILTSGEKYPNVRRSEKTKSAAESNKKVFVDLRGMHKEKGGEDENRRENIRA
jgi:hypothetical protein